MEQHKVSVLSVLEKRIIYEFPHLVAIKQLVRDVQKAEGGRASEGLEFLREGLRGVRLRRVNSGLWSTDELKY